MVQFERLGILLRPETDAQAVFNAGMIREGNTVHMLYRYCEKRGIWHGKTIDRKKVHSGHGEFPYVKNCIRYARLKTDGTLACDSKKDVIFPDAPGIVGCEDPRIVAFEGYYYIFYCTYDNIRAKVSIARTRDFQSYEKMGVIDNFAHDKDAFIFPERFNGKIALMHRIDPGIQIDYFDSFETMLDPENWKDYQSKVSDRTILGPKNGFRKVGGGVPPIKTEMGWLLLYHEVDDSRLYHVGAMLLDLKNPEKIIAHIPYHVLSPETDYEISGDYNGCVFPQGYYMDGDDIVICYGAGDRYTALAKANLQMLLDELNEYRL